MKTRTTRLFTMFALVMLVACGSKKDGDATGGGGGGAAAKPAASKTTPLPKLGLQADVPGEEVRVDDGMGEQSHMVNSVAMGGMHVEVAASAQKLDEVKADADMYNPKNLKTEELPDGFVVTFENTGSMGTNYWVDVRRTIDGKNIKCSSTGTTAAQQAAVVSACKSLRK